jgi:hypothetical protein
MYGVLGSQNPQKIGQQLFEGGCGACRVPRRAPCVPEVGAGQ